MVSLYKSQSRCQCTLTNIFPVASDTPHSVPLGTLLLTSRPEYADSFIMEIKEAYLQQQSTSTPSLSRAFPKDNILDLCTDLLF